MRIERSDLEAKLGQIQEVVEETTESAKNAAVLIGVAVVVVVALAFVFGRRKGKKHGAARVEVYRL